MISADSLPGLLVEHLPSHEFLGELVTSKLRYYPTVTRQAYRNMGRVTELIDTGKLATDLQVPELNAAEDRVMICGSPGMLSDFRRILDGRGLHAAPRIGTPGHYVFERAFVDK